MYWYEANKNDSAWNGGGLDFVLLAFAVTAPISAAIGTLSIVLLIQLATLHS